MLQEYTNLVENISMHWIWQISTLRNDTLGNKDPRTLFRQCSREILNESDAIFVIEKMQYEPYEVNICLDLLGFHEVNHLEIEPRTKIFRAFLDCLGDWLS